MAAVKACGSHGPRCLEFFKASEASGLCELLCVLPVTCISVVKVFNPGGPAGGQAATSDLET